MEDAVMVIHFGEPPGPDRQVVEEYLANIFYQNADLEGADTEAAARIRAAELASRRAPGLIEEYERIGGSPMNEQAREQANELHASLAERGHDVTIVVAFQFLEPSIPGRIQELQESGIHRLVALPIYPLCGPSTTVAALEQVEMAIDEWELDTASVSGWHRHPQYLRIRAANLRRFLDQEGIRLDDSNAALVFSAHGTPVHYLREGSRYVRYVEEFCAALAGLVGGAEFVIGYQNHANRDIPWTEPDVDAVITGLDAERAVVEPVSFMHEQSETLSELDIELAEVAAEAGIAFHRVPIPHDDPSFPELLADLVEPFLAGVDPAMYQLRRCECASVANAYCLNASRR